MSAQATLNLNVPTAAGNVTVNLLVTSGNASDTEIAHDPASARRHARSGRISAC